MALTTELPSFSQYFLAKGFNVGEPRVITPGHRRILRAVSDWFLGRVKGGMRNLSISVPPRFGKTIIVGDMIEYTMAIWPDSEFIYTSYSGDLAVGQVRKIKETLDSDWYHALFPWMYPTEGQQKAFRTRQGGSVLGVGIGGTITGFGAGKKMREGFGGGIIIDDPLKADEARSEAARDHVRNWYTGTLLSRRNRKTTPILMIAQRLHPEDLVGHVQGKFSNLWHFVKIPAIERDATETLWPDSYSFAELMQLKEVDPFAYFSQYQQEPIIPGGSIIKRTWWRTYDFDAEVQAGTFRQWKVILTGDTAFKTGDANDYSAFQAWCVTYDRLLLLDGICGKWEFHDLQKIAGSFYEKWADFQPNGKVDFYIEDKASGTPLAQVLNEAGVPVTAWKPSEFDFPDDKVSRMKACAIPTNAGHVYLPAGNPYNETLMDEAAAFSSNGTHIHDDNCDAFTMAVSLWKWLGGDIVGEDAGPVAIAV